MSLAEGAGWKIELVDDVPPVKPDWPATWKSIRHHFGIEGFGINGVTKDAGNVLIPEHDEGGSGQEEVYFVHRGQVKATLDGEEQTVGEGGLVYCAADTKRKLESLASPTTVLVVGGTPGKAYELPGWES
jgi:hypothetical protein